MRSLRLLSFALPVALALSVSGCGHSEEEWQMQLDKYGKLSTEHEEAKKRVEALEAELKAMGLKLVESNDKLGAMSASMEEQAKALAEYKARARQLELIKARFEMLRRKLDELTRLGLAVSIRHNRMVISLPGDVLFDSGRDTLKKEGQQILGKVAAVIRADAQLLARDYQVAGHTDSKPFTGGHFKDNWGLSLMRAREVLLYLGKDGGMPLNHWSATGFADQDPVATNNTDDGRQKNRRCDLIVVPSVEEMLDLKSLTN